MKTIHHEGFGAGHSDASWNRELAKTLGISTVPSIVGIINGRVVHFRGDYTLKNLKEFVRKLIPARITVEVSPGLILRFWSIIYLKNKSVSPS